MTTTATNGYFYRPIRNCTDLLLVAMMFVLQLLSSFPTPSYAWTTALLHQRSHRSAICIPRRSFLTSFDGWSQQQHRRTSALSVRRSNTDGSSSRSKAPPRTKKRDPVAGKKTRRGTPRSKAKNQKGSDGRQKFQRRPPPLLTDYQRAYDEQIDRKNDNSIGATCPHFQECAGCTVGAQIHQTNIVQAAQRYFANERYDGGAATTNRENSAAATASYHQQQYPVILPSPVTKWRTQAKLVVGNKSKSNWKNDGCIFGLYQKGSHDLLPIPDCVVHHPSVSQAMQILERSSARAGISAFSEDGRDGDLRYVQLQVERVTGRVCLTLVWNSATLKDCQPGLARLVKQINKEDPKMWHSIWCHCNDGLGNNIFSKGSGRWHRLSGPEFLREPLPVATAESMGTAAGWLYFSPLTFRQGNMDGFDILALDVARAVPPRGNVCELYGGVGVLGLTALAYHQNNDTPLGWLRCSDENPSNPRCFQRAVDSLPVAMTGRHRSYNDRFSKHTRSQNHANGIDEEAGMTLAELAARMDAGEASPFESSKSKESPEKTSYMIASAGKALRSGQALGAGVLIVDPPRKGLEDEVLDELCKPFNPDQAYVEDSVMLTVPDDEQVNWVNDVQTLIYVSCGFDALARDCDRLLSATGAGWTLVSSTGYILFPGSDHVETLAIFERE